MSNDVEVPPPGYLLFQKILPAISVTEKRLEFSDQHHIKIVDKICQGKLFGTNQVKMRLLDEKGNEYIVVIKLQNSENGQQPIMGFTVGALVVAKQLKHRDRLLFYSMDCQNIEYQSGLDGCIRVRIKRGTCCRCNKQKQSQGLIACCRPICDKAFHIDCIGVEEVPLHWECPECEKDHPAKSNTKLSEDSSERSDDSDSNDSNPNPGNTEQSDTNRHKQQQHSKRDADDVQSSLGHVLPPQRFIEQVQQFYLPAYDLQRCFEALVGQMAGREMLAPPNLKECAKCKQVKGWRYYFRSYFSADGLQAYCRQCKNYCVYDGDLGLGSVGVNHESLGNTCVSCRAFQPADSLMDEMCETCAKHGFNPDGGIVDMDEEGLEEKEGEAKKCLKCFKVRRVDMFWRNIGAKDGYDSRCKICKTLAKKRNNNSKRKRTLEDIQAERDRGRMKRMQRPAHIKDEQDFKQEIQLLSDLNQILVVDVKEAMKSCEKALEVSRLVLRKILQDEPNVDQQQINDLTNFNQQN